ncbi:TraM recognition domain-containing protein [uncultured Roseobacter sp.]|uniref:TraM recognition domain-containing protein n=1 Tax=uncultured Roseobacter sp. TaxID=114847 RepID=UPI0026152329|nr:TraM recognition domain-containing protein [uncultured Roseobacter sp.]
MLVLKLPFRMIFWCLRRLAKNFRKKGWVVLTVMVLFMSLDMIFPVLGGNLTTIALVLGPAMLMGLAFGVLKRLDGTMSQFIALSSYMAFAGTYALFRAWSKAIDGSLPDAFGSLSRWIFGPLWNAAAGLFAALLGQGQSVPMPIWGPLPFSQHLLAMDPLLTGLSLFVLAWAARIFLYGARRYGGDTRRTSGEQKMAANRMTPPWRANWVLHGVAGNIKRHLRALVSRPRLPPSHLVIGFGPPPMWRPWLWPWMGIGWLVSRVMSVEFTIFDLRQMIVADARNGALILGGAGAGKTLIQTAWLTYSTANKILIETQGNVFDKDRPLIEAAGRKLHVISSDIGHDTATINVLSRLDPEEQDFWDQVMRLSGLIIQERGEHGALERCTRELVACTIGNVVFGAHLVGEVPRLDTVYTYLTDPELAEDLQYWTRHGHPAFRELCSTLADRIADPEFQNALAAIFSNELGFLAHPIKRAMVCGTGDHAFDPEDLLHDPKLDVAIQISQATIDVSGALLRLLLGALIEPRIRLSAEQVKKTRAHGVTVWIDELNAFAGPVPGSGARMLSEIVDFHRQKGIRWVFSAQNTQQIERGWGEGTYAKWANSAVVRIFGKVGAEPQLDQHVTEVAGKTLQEKIEKIPGAGGGWRAYQISRNDVDLLPGHELSKMGESQMIAFVRTDHAGLVKLKLWRPGHFAHPIYGHRYRAAKDRFGGRRVSKARGAYDNLIDDARQALLRKSAAEEQNQPPRADQAPDAKPPRSGAEEQPEEFPTKPEGEE